VRRNDRNRITASWIAITVVLVAILASGGNPVSGLGLLAYSAFMLAWFLRSTHPAGRDKPSTAILFVDEYFEDRLAPAARELVRQQRQERAAGAAERRQRQDRERERGREQRRRQQRQDALRLAAERADQDRLAAEHRLKEDAERAERVRREAADQVRREGDAMRFRQAEQRRLALEKQRQEAGRR
jgi:hypothetical protein